MKPIVFALQFKGKAAPMPGTTGAMKASLTANAAKIGLKAAGGSAKADRDQTAKLESLVVVTGEGTFIETGVISFGRRGALSFSTAGQGSIGPGSGTAQGLTTGAVIWRVVGGEGQFAGATTVAEKTLSVTRTVQTIRSSWRRGKEDVRPRRLSRNGWSHEGLVAMWPAPANR